MKLWRIFFILLLTSAAHAENIDQLITAGISEGFGVGVAIFCIARIISYGVELIKHCLDAPKDD